MKKTKIVCTLGPASDTEEIITKMVKAGMNVARINFSHGTYEEHAKKIEIIKKVREKLNVPLPILLDSKGPEFRIKTFKDGKVTLTEGQTFTFTADEIIGDETIVSVSYKGIAKDLFVGDKILLNNGLMVFEVTSVEKNNVICKVVTGGVLSDRKSMFFPDKTLNMVYLSEQDKKDFLFGIEQGVDFIACSFVSTAQNLIDVRNFLIQNGNPNIDLIAKIENRAGVNNIESIIHESNGIMIGRGDMGVEIPYEELPHIQKHIIKTCRLLGKRCITATEMLESMIYNPRPTRAEISDVANAVYDGTSAIMLSGETAAGNYPVEAVSAMAKIAIETENSINYDKRLKDFEFVIKDVTDALSHSVCTLASEIKAKAIVVCTTTGGTARMVSRFRPSVDIIGMTTNEEAYRKLALSWGVMPALTEEVTSSDVLFYNAKNLAKNLGYAKKGDMIVITGGATTGKSGNTNLIDMERV